MHRIPISGNALIILRQWIDSVFETCGRLKILTYCDDTEQDIGTGNQV
jgi:hypothetical protein